MVTKNELVAIISALTTDFDSDPAASETEARDNDEALNDFFMQHKDSYVEEQRKAS